MIVTRFAPSPTGELHLGHAFSALTAFAAAQAAAGRFLLRIEDIDQGRCRPAFAQSILTDLAWLGLVWEQPVRRQSEHFDEYRSALDRLAAEGLLYPCFCTRKDIAAAGQAPHGPDGPLYPGTCRALSEQERAERCQSGQPFALRLDCAAAVRRVGPLVWHDHDAGAVVARPDLFGDVVLARKDCPTSYHLAVTLDDARQGVTLVTRGVDLFEATHIHRLLQALFDLPVPDYRHHPLLTGPDGRRLAKRDHAQTLRSLREQGYSAAEVRALVGV
ncbi:tRNA glutamyl-Q(34) synthetase GluQRS [Magnetospirillum fulvum]|uniref:Glutamyl-and glutaminyl-tRNA synthetase n=1 Tax=Magnetospirillum fulvum MGU-K5 TaxID=1316936 RepID=S9S9G8_MAGFU|nr:tRNA glutamyl-Q(34) synthetase GluQRS [Magnetospirillum fulvum]EPY00688.1 glutamyl- and glutaminyl-tRNA synthetase [Magnetospirillum fulvum MGU-K5]